MNLTILFSGGKDSTFAVFWALQQGHEIRLVSLMPESDSMMFHFPNVEFCRLQAQAMGLPIDFLKVKNSNELEALEAYLAKMKKKGMCEGVVSGALESEYQKQRIDGICHNIGVRSFSPLWRTGGIMLEEVTQYFEAIFTRVAAENFSDNFLGKRFDQMFLQFAAASSPSINPRLEGGEGETFVLDAPFFAKKIRLQKSEKKKDGGASWLEFNVAMLAAKKK